MGEGWLIKLKRFILWDYSRGSVPYDIMVALILAFIFLTPRDLFRDQPKAKDVVMLEAEGGGAVFWLDPELLAGFDEAERPAAADALIKRQRRGRNLRLVRLEPIFDSENEIKGYMAVAGP